MATDRAGQAQFTYHVDKATLRALKDHVRAVGPDARRWVRKRLKAVGEIVRTDIRKRTPVGGRSGGLRAVGRTKRGVTRTSAHRPGLLKKSTKLKIGSLSVTVYNDAKAVSKRWPGGYRYGKRIEFDPRINRPFFYPAYEATKDKAIAELAKVLDDIGRGFRSD